MIVTLTLSQLIVYIKIPHNKIKKNKNEHYKNMRIWRPLNIKTKGQQKAFIYSSIYSTKMEQTITLTFGDQAENHVGMQQIGKLSDVGFSRENLLVARQWFENAGAHCELEDLDMLLSPDLRSGMDYPGGGCLLLVVRGGVNALLSDMVAETVAVAAADMLYTEQSALPVDTHAFMYGRVVNKHARYNLCFAPEGQEPAYSEGRGRIISFDTVPLTSHLHRRLGEVLGPAGTDLAVEGNYYYDPSRCGIGFHGDAERRKVVGVRLGMSMPFVFSWFLRGEAVPNATMSLSLNHGDLYIMMEKTCGFDWRLKRIPTLRHAAGCTKYTRIPGPRKPRKSSKKEKPVE